ncbi:neuroblast differentiation-associated protein AHNAK-like, partial [Poeciliopsis prolifica]|uniref:neuroblast differentiation-associated protein AHNAK-like n=1 Tax=Poeciliopsis prolifica TaxID=188132 RepID=UPI0024135BC2
YPPSGKFKWPTLKKPKWALSQPKVKGPDVDLDAELSGPDLELSAPKIDGKINSPDIDLNLPKADVDIKKPELDIDPPSGKIKWPTLKKPKWALSQPKVNGPDVDLDANLSSPDLELSAPKIDGKINSPDVDLNLPKADVDIKKPELDIDRPSGKFKVPTLKKPKWALSQPKVKGPDVDLDAELSGPDLELSAPTIDGKINSPDIDLNLPKADVDIKKPELDIDPPSGKIKWPTLKKPKWALSQPKVNGPDVDLDANLSSPDLELSAPKIDGKINSPDVDLNLPKADVDIKKPELDINRPSGKFKVPTLKKPKWALSQPKVKGPDVDLDAELSGPDLELSAPTIDGKINSPDIDLNLPKADVDIKKPELDIDPPSGKFKMPTFKKPKWALSQPKVNGPDVDLDADLSGPDLHLSAPKIEAEIHTPDLNLEAPKTQLQGQKLDLNAKLPNTELEAPDVTLKSPNLDTNAPKLALTAPDGQIKTPGVELDPVLGDFKLPHFKVPALDLSSPNAGIEAPKVNLSDPDADASISVPAVELNGPKVEGPKVDISAPDVDANEKSRFPHFKIPKFSFSGSKPKTGEVNDSADDDDEAASNIETDVPVFRFHSLPKSTFDGPSNFSDAFGLSKRDDEEQDYVVRKGIRLPVSNAAAAATSKIDIMQILKLSKEKLASFSPTEDANLRLAAPSLDVGASAEGSSLGTLKIEKPGSVEGPADEDQRLSQSLANMLCLDSDDPVAV